MELSETKSGNSLENNTGSGNGLHRNSEKSIESITNWNLSEKDGQLKLVGFVIENSEKKRK